MYWHLALLCALSTLSGPAAAQIASVDEQEIRSGILAYGVLDQNTRLSILETTANTTAWIAPQKFDKALAQNAAADQPIELHPERLQQFHQRFDVVRKRLQNHSTSSKATWRGRDSIALLGRFADLAKEADYHNYFQPDIFAVANDGALLWLYNSGNAFFGTANMRLPLYQAPESGDETGHFTLEPGPQGTTPRRSWDRRWSSERGGNFHALMLTRPVSKWWAQHCPSLILGYPLSGRNLRIEEPVTVAIKWATGRHTTPPELLAAEPIWTKAFKARWQEQEKAAAQSPDERLAYYIEGGAEIEEAKLLVADERHMHNAEEQLYRKLYQQYVGKTPDRISESIEELERSLQYGDSITALTKDFGVLRNMVTASKEELFSLASTLKTATAKRTLEILNQHQWSLHSLAKHTYQGWLKANPARGVKRKEYNNSLWGSSDYILRRGPFTPYTAP